MINKFVPFFSTIFFCIVYIRRIKLMVHLSNDKENVGMGNMRRKYTNIALYKKKKIRLVSKQKYFISEINRFRSILSQLDIKNRKLVVDKTIRFMNIDMKSATIVKKTGRFTPEYRKFEFVHCHFTGIGFEWDFPHFALIWDIDPYMDSVLVIPTTSTPRNEHIDVFSVDQIQGLPKGKTYLLISDMTRVSRKRLEKIVYTHKKHGLTNPMLPKSWESRIHHGIVSRTIQLPSFEKVVINHCGLNMVDGLTLYNNLKFKSIVFYNFDKTSNVLTYRIWDKSENETLELIPPNTSTLIWKEQKEKKLLWLNSKEIVIRSLAKQFFKEIYGI